MYTVVETKDSYYSSLGLRMPGAATFLCDGKNEVEDKDSLPTTGIGIGSRALMIESGNIYILGPSREWIKYGGGSIMN